jgi:hypothetical protein
VLSRPAWSGVSIQHGSRRVPPLPGVTFGAQPRPAQSDAGTRLTAWIVRILMVGAGGFVLFDLFLLLSGVRH